MTIEEAKERTTGFKEVEFKYSGPKWDAHTHLYKLDDTIEFVKIAKDYNVKKYTAIVRDDWQKYDKAIPDTFVFARFINSENFFKSDIQAVIDDVQGIYDAGYPVVKFWYAPRWRKYVEKEWAVQAKGFRIDDPTLDPIYKKMVDLGLILLIHVGDPDIFYNIRYQPESYYGTKEQHLQEFQNIIARHPNLKILGAHMGGQPEHLDTLGNWFEKYPNFYVDTSSAKWMAREFSYNPDDAAEFFTKYQDRILFGTDIVTGRTDREPIPAYYYIRYLSLLALLETDVRNLPLPIADPENDNRTVINGLDLPQKVLRKVYWDNSKNLFK